MNTQALFIVLAAVFAAVDTAIVDHDKVEPFPQPEPVTISEKIAVKFKPVLQIVGGCAAYPAVNATGCITGGLKGTKGTSECTSPPLGTQVNCRAAWHGDKYVIMFAWYFPKGFWGGMASRRHDWASAVLWIDNPVSENPSVLGITGTVADDEYSSEEPAPNTCFIDGSKPNLYRYLQPLAGRPVIDCTTELPVPETSSGDPQNLIMWNLPTEAARETLSTASFDVPDVPFNDEYFVARLDRASPL